MALRKKRFRKNRLRDLVVKPRLPPGARLALAVAATSVLFIAGGLIYNYGLSSAGFDSASVAQERQELQDEIQKLKAENQELREGLARAQLALQMDHTAYQELDRSLNNSSAEIVKLREELNFYRNIISPSDSVGGLQIQRLDISRTETENQYRYKLVLVQPMKNERSIKGRVEFEVKGEQEGKETSLHFPEPNERAIAVNFRYFQDVEGQMRLPKNFRPQQVKVQVLPGNAKAVEQHYDWPDV